MGRVLLTIPAHNEEGILYTSVHRIVEGLQGSGPRLPPGDRGGRLDGRHLLRNSRLQAEMPDLIVQRIPSRVGRGLGPAHAVVGGGG